MIMEGLRLFNLSINASRALPELPELPRAQSRSALTWLAAQPASVLPVSGIPQMQKPRQLREPL